MFPRLFWYCEFKILYTILIKVNANLFKYIIIIIIINYSLFIINIIIYYYLLLFIIIIIIHYSLLLLLVKYSDFLNSRDIFGLSFKQKLLATVHQSLYS